MFARPEQSLWRLLVPQPAICVWRSRYADVRGEKKKRVHFTTRQANKYGNEQPRRGSSDHGKDQGGARERSANRPQAAQAASPPPRQAGIWCEYRVDGKGVGGYIFTVCQKGFQGSLVMIGVSIRQFTHRKLMSVVVWCLDLYRIQNLLAYAIRISHDTFGG